MQKGNAKNMQNQISRFSTRKSWGAVSCVLAMAGSRFGIGMGSQTAPWVPWGGGGVLPRFGSRLVHFVSQTGHRRRKSDTAVENQIPAGQDTGPGPKSSGPKFPARVAFFPIGCVLWGLQFTGARSSGCLVVGGLLLPLWSPLCRRFFFDGGVRRRCPEPTIFESRG